uniref:Presenilin n=1 Tax=Panagrolaimus superbus TaxID=310955 RepID=A0A914YXR9_9BILA
MGSNRPPVSSIELEDISAERRQRSVEPRRSRSHRREDEEKELKYGAAHVIRLFVPVSLCMALVIFTMNTIGYFSRDDGIYLVYTPFHKKTDNTAEKIAMSFGNAFIVLGVVVVMTSILIGLYYFRFYKVIHGWLLLSTVMLLSMFTTIYLQQVFETYNMAVDYITYSFFLWNFAVMGMICIHWKGPLYLQQIYLITVSALMALILIKYMPDWTVWTVLGLISVWDLIAVLCPHGPLRMLVEISQQRNEPIFPALIYSSTIIYPYILFGAVDSQIPDSDVPLVPSTNSTAASSTAGPSNSRNETAVRFAPKRKKKNQENKPLMQRTPESSNEQPRTQQRRSQPSASNQAVEVVEEIVEDQGIKLGLGDFIFYSVLVGKASVYGDWNTTISCYVAILVGLAFTLMLLAVFRKALPALPISIFAGMVFYFSSREFITPFMNELTIRQIVP